MNINETKTGMILRILILVLSSSTFCFSQKTQLEDTLNTVEIYDSSWLDRVLDSSLYNSSEIFMTRIDTPSFYTISRTLFYKDRIVAEYFADIFLTKTMYIPRVISDSINIIEQVAETDLPSFNAAFHNIAIKSYTKKRKKRKTNLSNREISINDSNGIILHYTLRNAFSDSANSFHLEFTGDSINELALLSYSWEGVMPNTSFPKKKRSWSSRGSNIFDPKTQVILSHKNTIRINQFTEEVSIQIKESPLVIDDIDKYKILSYLDLYGLAKQINKNL
jgi:hypothetical protein